MIFETKKMINYVILGIFDNIIKTEYTTLK